ncbi:hypothetical protein Sm713_46980 [Streptomyces sp. TS71-3]|nr:hypothetical protein Sm713_46980 [Streptomyces sp. TS71-3]
MSLLSTGARRARPLAVLALAMAAAVLGGQASATGSAAPATTDSVPAAGHPANAGAVAAASLPRDIYAAGGTPCVAAHSTTRALYGAYNGLLYQVRRSSDNATRASAC